MRIGIPKEIHPGERRVATTPDVAAQLKQLGFDVAIETGAGAAANFADDAYRAAGASVVDAAQLWSESDIVLKVRPPAVDPVTGIDEVDRLRKGQTLVSFLVAGAEPGAADARSPSAASPRSRWTAFRASRGRRRWTRSARWPTSPAIAR